MIYLFELNGNETIYMQELLMIICFKTDSVNNLKSLSFNNTYNDSKFPGTSSTFSDFAVKYDLCWSAWK